MEYQLGRAQHLLLSQSTRLYSVLVEVVMIDLETLRDIVLNNWHSEDHIIREFPLSGETKFAARWPVMDRHTHYLKTVYGVEIFLSEDEHRRFVGYNIIDSEKFMWFVLRWS
jgi:hypothetical protein